MVRMRLQSELATIDLAGPTDCSDRHARTTATAIVRSPRPRSAAARREAGRSRSRGSLRSKQAIGALLLDQSVLSGVGNVYRAEALFVNGINPRPHRPRHRSRSSSTRCGTRSPRCCARA